MPETLMHWFTESQMLPQAVKQGWERITRLFGALVKHRQMPRALDRALADSNLLGDSSESLETRIRDFALEDLRALFAPDPWLCNYLVSIWERAHARTVVTTYPWHVTLAIANHCNARCVFCPVWLRSKANLDLGSAPHLARLLRYTKTLLVTGGEPTVHPQFEDLLLRLREILDPRAFVSFLTNGARLDRFRQALAQENFGFTISLNAATPATHQALMGLGPDTFSRILETVRWLRSENHHVDLSFVVVRGNLEELPAFISLGEELRVNGLYVRTLNPGGYNYALLHQNPYDFEKLPPYRHPEFAHWLECGKAAIQEACIPVYANPEQWGVVLHSASLPTDVDWATARRVHAAQPALVRTKGCTLRAKSPAPPLDGNPYHRNAPFPCRYPWHATKILDTSLRLSPCACMYRVLGYEEVGLSAAEDFFELWNSPGMVRLRETLQSGPLLPACRTCPTQL